VARIRGARRQPARGLQAGQQLLAAVAAACRRSVDAPTYRRSAHKRVLGSSSASLVQLLSQGPLFGDAQVMRLSIVVFVNLLSVTCWLER